MKKNKKTSKTLLKIFQPNKKTKAAEDWQTRVRNVIVQVDDWYKVFCST